MQPSVNVVDEMQMGGGGAEGGVATAVIGKVKQTVSGVWEREIVKDRTGIQTGKCALARDRRARAQRRRGRRRGQQLTASLAFAPMMSGPATQAAIPQSQDAVIGTLHVQSSPAPPSPLCRHVTAAPAPLAG